MRVIGLVGAGHMGSGLGWALREGGHDVVTSLAGRSERTALLASQAGLRIAATLADVVAEADVLLVVTPPGAALDAATEIAAAAGTGRRLVVDLNATSPATAAAAAEVITGAGFDFVDGSISGPPPTVRPGARIYLSGPRAAEVADLRWTHAKPVVVSDRVGAASAVKMSTASVYKGTVGLVAQAMRSASAYGVLEPVLADLGDRLASPYDVALAATKAHRYVAEMHEIAASQAAAGLTPALFEAFAAVWADIAERPLADGRPETLTREITAQQVADGLRVRQAGDGDPVLLLHGSGGPDTVSLLVTHLAEGHRVLAPIHPGWGGTSLPENPGGVAGLAATYLDLLESQGLSGVTVAGVSFGGWVAAEMAAADRDHRIGRLVLIDALGPRIPGHRVGMPTTLPPANLAALQAYTEGMLEDPTLLDRLQALTIPTLLLWGENDPVIDVDFGRRYASAIPGARFEVIPGAGHVPMRDAPEATFAVLDGFLKG